MPSCYWQRTRTAAGAYASYRCQRCGRTRTDRINGYGAVYRFVVVAGVERAMSVHDPFPPCRGQLAVGTREIRPLARGSDDGESDGD